MKRRKRALPTVLYKDPHIQSQAALILLRIKYSKMLREYPPGWRIWLSFRNRFLKREERSGPLACYYCGHSPLFRNSRITPDENKATIDHVHPRSKGGREYDESNLVVSCIACNAKKGDKMLEDLPWTDGGLSSRRTNSGDTG